VRACVENVISGSNRAGLKFPGEMEMTFGSDFGPLDLSRAPKDGGEGQVFPFVVAAAAIHLTLNQLIFLPPPFFQVWLVENRGRRVRPRGSEQALEAGRPSLAGRQRAGDEDFGAPGGSLCVSPGRAVHPGRHSGRRRPRSSERATSAGSPFHGIRNAVERTVHHSTEQHQRLPRKEERRSRSRSGGRGTLTRR